MSKNKFKRFIRKEIFDLHARVNALDSDMDELGKQIELSRKEKKKYRQLSLHPCVFCGSEHVEVKNVLSEKEFNDGDVSGEFAVVCNACRGRGPIEDDAAEAARMWNDYIETV